VSDQAVRAFRGVYLDSLLLMAATVAMERSPGVDWAGAVMATPRGLTELADAGFQDAELEDLGANDLVLAVRGGDPDEVEAALEAGRANAFDHDADPVGASADRVPRSIEEAVGSTPGANVAIVSVPGEYAALEAHHALTSGLHVLLFSDGVSVEEEIELKTRATALGKLVMGPGAGTAVLAGTGLGFANVAATPRSATGAVGVIAAAGTGAQEVAALLDRWHVPVSQVIGVGGRDLSEQVGGAMAAMAAQALDADEQTQAVLLVSKPPAAAAAARVLEACGETQAVAVFLGIEELSGHPGARLEPTLERAAAAAAGVVGATVPALDTGLQAAVAEACGRLAPGRRTVHGLFSGGTLCYEAQLVLEGLLGPVYSNEPLRRDHKLPAPAGAHVLLDLGAEEYTRGVPHPMIDPSTREALLLEQSQDPEVAVVLLDVVLGHGSHPDPAGALVPICAQLMADGGPQVVAYVLGTEGDPQVYSRQRAALEAVGCIVPETNARAAYAAAGLALRRPDLAGSGLLGPGPAEDRS
jgi:FdrA protein